MTTRIVSLLVAVFAIINGPATAQTIGYADAIANLAASCGKDVDRYCKMVPLGGGQILQCLNQNQAVVAIGCKTSIGSLRALLQKRAAARAAVFAFVIGISGSFVMAFSLAAAISWNVFPM